MRRREFLGGLAMTAAWPRSAFADTERKLALLMPFAEGDIVATRFVDSRRRSLAAVGWKARAPDGGIIIPPQALLAAFRKPVISSAARERLPVIYSDVFFVKDGGLLSYGADLVDQYARAASYIDRIFKATKPSGALGLSMPSALMARADVVIE